MKKKYKNTMYKNINDRDIVKIYSLCFWLEQLACTVFHTKRVENWFLDTLIILSKTKCPIKNKHVQGRN